MINLFPLLQLGASKFILGTAIYSVVTIHTPTLLIAEARVRRNIKSMLDKAKLSGVKFRPHFKTHQSVDIGDIYRDLGVNTITVSSVSMARYFADHGWDDITIAFPVNILEIDEINALASSITIHILVESTDTVSVLDQQLDNSVGCWIKVDLGYRRTGIATDDETKILDLAKIVDKSNNMEFKGLLTHAGHSYTSDREKKSSIFNQAQQDLSHLRSVLHTNNLPSLISYGDTPTCSIFSDFSSFDEIRPGNFVYYDLQQYSYGSCTGNEIAVAVACPVVAIHPERDEVLIYGGGVHFSKDVLSHKSRSIYGYIVEREDRGWGKINSEYYLKSISQEHGIVSVPSSHISQLNVGDLLYILPVHSCMTANLLRDNQIII